MQKAQNQISNAKNTANILKQYLADELKKWDAIPEFASYLLEYVFGSKIHEQMDGFIQFAKEDKSIDEMDIKITLAHDVGGALRGDKLMIPRVSGYAEYSNLKK